MKLFRDFAYRSLLGVATWVLGTATVSGAVISGQIGMMGKVDLDAPLNVATTLVSFSNARVGYGSGVYDVPGAVAVNTPVLVTPLSFTASPSAPVVLWEFGASGDHYSFEIHDLSYSRFSIGENSFLSLSGSGVALKNGEILAPGEFCFSTQQCTDAVGTTVTWSSETILLSVPEGGKTMIYLILGIIGIESIRRRLHIPRVCQ